MAAINSTVEAVNSSIPIIGPAISGVQGIIGIVTWLLGGAVGIFIIFSILKIIEMRRIKSTLKQLEKKINRIDKRLKK